MQIALQVQVGPEAPEWIRLLPVGEVTLWDSREPFVVQPEDLAVLAEDWRRRGIDLVVDYEHQTLGSGRAPAAGWVKDMQTRPDGLWGRVEWTEQAQVYLANREYRYLSPVVQLDEERRVTRLMHVALVNVPAIAYQLPLVAKGAIITNKDGGRDARPTEREAGKAMLEKLKTMYAAAEGAGEEQLLALAGKHQEAFLAVQELAEALGLEQGAKLSEVKATVLALKQGGDRLTTVETELAALKADSHAQAVSAAVEEALTAGKVTPAQRPWAEDYAGKDLEGFKSFVAQAPVIAPAGSFRFARQEGEKGLTAAEEAFAAQLGVTPEAFKATRDKMAQQGPEGGK